jgi:hypothetical protein
MGGADCNLTLVEIEAAAVPNPWLRYFWLPAVPACSLLKAGAGGASASAPTE